MKKPHKNLWPPLYGLALVLFTVYVLLDAFVIPRTYAAQQTAVTAAAVSSETAQTAAAGSSSDAAASSSGSSSAAAAVTDTSYSDGNISITITQYRENDTTIYVADVTLASVDALQTAFAQNTYGKNITATTSAIASECGAILAINGDYYSARSGYVVRNGVLYRDSSSDSSQEDFVLWADGSGSIVTEGSASAQELVDQGALQVLSFGPGLVENGEITVSENEEVGRAKASNPRTAIGVISPLHYVFVVSDGRTDASAGLSLYQLAQFMQGLGVQTAYNLDGGGSSTMVFNGSVVNQPTTNGRIGERKVSDIVYIG
jgi:exopolysaccharide biosynthesis protein